MALPSWLSDRLPSERQLHTKLTQRHVAETMYDDERPFFTLQQIQQRVEPDVSKVTVRNRLRELEERGVVRTDRSTDQLTLYYIDHPASDWPLSPEGKRSLEAGQSGRPGPLTQFLRDPDVRRIISEELWRSVAWAGFALFGWAIIIQASASLDATVWTALGLPVLTWASLTVGMIGTRLTTGHELQVQTLEGLHIVTLGGVLLGGFWAVFLILAFGYSAVLVTGLYVLTVVGFGIYYWQIILPRFEPALEQ